MTLPKTLLVTGINGYIASVLGQRILEHGYNLRGTVRSQAKANSLLQGPWAPYLDRIEIVEVSDVGASGALDEAVKGVHGVFHVANAVDFSLTTWEKAVIPPVNGVKSVINSCYKHAGPQLESVIFTSTSITMTTVVTDPPTPGYIFTESDFEEGSIEALKGITEKSPLFSKIGEIAYSAGKRAAEKTIWEMRDILKPDFAITTMHPSIVTGRPVYLPPDPTQMAMTLGLVYHIWSGGRDGDLPPRYTTGSGVDVWDTADVHLWAFENCEQADGQRYLVTSGYVPCQGIADFLREKYPERESKIIRGSPGEEYVTGTDWNKREVRWWYPDELPQVSGERLVKEAGMVWKPLEQSIAESVESFKIYENPVHSIRGKL